MIADADVVEHAAQPAQGRRLAHRAAVAPELTASFQVRLQIEKHAGDAAAVQHLIQAREHVAEIRRMARGRSPPRRPAQSARMAASSTWPLPLAAWRR